MRGVVKEEERQYSKEKTRRYSEGQRVFFH